MLLEFKTKNYKSFLDEAIFSMTPAPRQTGLDYSILKMKAGSKEYQGLCSAVVYGPNASGKTNLIGAMDTFRSIVLRGDIRNGITDSPNIAKARLEFIPNCCGVAEPTKFMIRFLEDGLLFEYTLICDLGPFMEANYDRRVLEESLFVNEKLVFFRKDSLEVSLPPVIKDYINKGIKRKTSKILELAEGSLVDTDLFLNNGFKSIYAQELVQKILNWFSNKFIVIYRSDNISLVREFSETDKNKLYIENVLTDMAKEFGITGNKLGYKTIGDKENEKAVLFSIVNETLIPAEVFESYGTIRFINEFPLVVSALMSGGTLVVDEFDASIHPMAMMSIINVFHNDEININHAQIIFNTHNPIFLNSTLLRRDEIKFVERDEFGNSIQYSLSDFKTAEGIRKGEDYMKNYFIDRYGAIKDVDFSSLLEKIITGKEVPDDE